jgi:hypothetical protein
MLMLPINAIQIRIRAITGCLFMNLLIREFRTLEPTAADWLAGSRTLQAISVLAFKKRDTCCQASPHQTGTVSPCQGASAAWWGAERIYTALGMAVRR